MTIFQNYRDLAHWAVALGVLHGQKNSDGGILAKIGPIEIFLPEELMPRLKELQGQEIAILRTDTDYRMRILNKQVKRRA